MNSSPSLDHDVAVGELHLALAQRLDLPALQHHAGLEPLLEEVVVGGLLVVGDAGGAFVFRGHGLTDGGAAPSLQCRAGPRILYENRPQIRPDLVQRARRCSRLVTDVAHYPEFLPWCDRAAVLAQDEPA